MTPVNLNTNQSTAAAKRMVFSPAFGSNTNAFSISFAGNTDAAREAANADKRGLNLYTIG